MSKIGRERGGRERGRERSGRDREREREREGGLPFISAVLPGDRTHH